MALGFTILGCGTSSGVPRVGNIWGKCDPAEPRNVRSRASIMVETGTTRLLIDTSPDLRSQLLGAQVDHVDAVLWTHDHADHCHGIDDLRQLYHLRGEALPGYARAETLGHLQRRFAYAFDGRLGYAPMVVGHRLPDRLMIGDIAISCVDQPHGPIFSTGFLFEAGGARIAYSTDFHALTDAMAELFAGVDVWIVDALRERPHPTHIHLALTLEAITHVGARRAILTHMDQSMDYATLCANLPAGVVPGHDLMKETVG